MTHPNGRKRAGQAGGRREPPVVPAPPHENTLTADRLAGHPASHRALPTEPGDGTGPSHARKASLANALRDLSHRFSDSQGSIHPPKTSAGDVAKTPETSRVPRGGDTTVPAAPAIVTGPVRSLLGDVFTSGDARSVGVGDPSTLSAIETTPGVPSDSVSASTDPDDFTRQSAGVPGRPVGAESSRVAGRVSGVQDRETLASERRASAESGLSSLFVGDILGGLSLIPDSQGSSGTSASELKLSPQIGNVSAGTGVFSSVQAPPFVNGSFSPSFEAGLGPGRLSFPIMSALSGQAGSDLGGLNDMAAGWDRASGLAESVRQSAAGFQADRGMSPAASRDSGPAIELSRTNELLQQLLDEVRRGRQPFLPVGDRNAGF